MKGLGCSICGREELASTIELGSLKMILATLPAPHRQIYIQTDIFEHEFNLIHLQLFKINGNITRNRVIYWDSVECLPLVRGGTPRLWYMSFLTPESRGYGCRSTARWSGRVVASSFVGKLEFFLSGVSMGFGEMRVMLEGC